MIYRQKKISYLTIVFLVILIIFIIVSNFINVSLQIETYSEVFPKAKWLLTRGNGGQIISHLIDYSSGHTTKYDLTQFERGEFISLKFNELNSSEKSINIGDTLISMRSSYVLDRLIDSQGELEVALANLKSQSSSEKEALIKEAESRIHYIDEKLNEQKILYDRTKQLFEKGLGSKQEYELQKWTYDLLEIEKKINAAQLDNLKTGVKPQEIAHLESQVNAARKRLNFIKERESQLTIVSPISGKVVSSFSPDTLLTIVDVNNVVLHAPVKVDHYTEFKVGQSVHAQFEQFHQSLVGEVISIDKEVKIINGSQTVFISLLFANTSNQMLPGMLLKNKLFIKEITLFQYMKRMITY